MPAATGGKHPKQTDGQAVDVDLSYSVSKGQVAFVEGWLGLTNDRGDSGDNISLTVNDEVYVFTVPSGLAVAKGAVVCIDTTDLTGHTPDDTAYNTSAASSTNRPLFRAVAAKNTDNKVPGKLLVGK